MTSGLFFTKVLLLDQADKWVLFYQTQFGKLEQKLLGPYWEMDRGFDIGISSFQLMYLPDTETGVFYL
jgi:hypothetical protein